MDNRRDILKSEITEFQQRLGIKVITTRNLKSIEDCRKAFVKIAEYYASISQGKLVNPGLDTEVDILRKKVKVLQEEKAELEMLKLTNIDLELTGFERTELEDIMSDETELNLLPVEDALDENDPNKLVGLVCPCCGHKAKKKEFLECDIDG